MNAALRANRGLACDAFPCPPDDLADYIVPRYSKSQVIEAGKLIAAKNPDATPDVIAAFRLAHDWRGAHINPMRRVRSELAKVSRRVQGQSVTAARLKRMQSIRRKMNRRPMTLFQMQDIAGARAIMRDMEGVRALVEYYQSGRSKFGVGRSWDYIGEPKRGGYRSVHLRLDCPSESANEAYAHLQVELQIRTQLQHSWATAVEAVGLVRGEELKGGDGNREWLRLFELMAAEFAAEEGRPLVPGVPADASERIAELRHLDGCLNAVRTLENYNQAMKVSESFRKTSADGLLYKITYDCDRRSVFVDQYSRFSRLYESVYTDENNLSLNSNIVTVEVDGVKALRAAYPNYFLDVRAFADRLKTRVFDAPSLRAPQPARERKPSKWGDLSFLRDMIES